MCAIHDQIVEVEKDCEFPMFSGHCSSRLFNEVRDARIKELQDEVRSVDV